MFTVLDHLRSAFESISSKLNDFIKFQKQEAKKNPEVANEVIKAAMMGFSGLKNVEGEPTLDWVMGKTKNMKEAPDGDEGRESKTRQEYFRWLMTMMVWSTLYYGVVVVVEFDPDDPHPNTPEDPEKYGKKRIAAGMLYLSLFYYFRFFERLRNLVLSSM